MTFDNFPDILHTEIPDIFAIDEDIAKEVQGDFASQIFHTFLH